MLPHKVYTFLIIVDLLNLLNLPAQPLQAAQPVPVTSPAPGAQLDVRTDGTSVIWQDYREASTATRPGIYAARLADRQEVPLLTDYYSQAEATIAGDWLAWSELKPCNSCFYRDTFVKNITTGKVVALGKGYKPVVAAESVVWLGQDSQGRGFLQVQNLARGTAPVTLGKIDLDTPRPAFDGQRVVWGQHSFAPPKTLVRQLLIQPITATTPTVIAEERTVSDSYEWKNFSWDFQGDLAAYAVDNQLYAVNLKTGTKQSLALSRAQSPTTDGRFVFWEDYQFYNRSYGTRVDLRGYDTVSGQYFEVTSNTGRNLKPHARNGALVWLHQDETNTSTVYTIKTSELLTGTAPTAQAVPVVSPSKATASNSQNIATTVAKQDMRSDGTYAVWSEICDQTKNKADIYAQNLTSGQEFVIANSTNEETMPDISGGLAVWKEDLPCPPYPCREKILAKKLPDGKITEIGEGTLPATNGKWVVWQDFGHLIVRDFSTMAPAITLPAFSSPDKNWLVPRPVISNRDEVIAGFYQLVGRGHKIWGLAGTNYTFSANPGSYLSVGGGQDEAGGWDISDGTVAYSANWRLNLRLNYNSTLPAVDKTIAYQAEYPTTDGRYVFWEDYQFDASGKVRVDLKGYDNLTNRYFDVVVDKGVNLRPQLRGGKLVWLHLTPQGTQIETRTLESILANLPPQPVPITYNAPGAPVTPFIDSTDYLSDVDTDGTRAIWVNTPRDGISSTAIYMATLAERKPQLITNEPYWRYLSPVIEGDWIGWGRDNPCPHCNIVPEVYLRNLKSGEQFKLGTGGGLQLAGEWAMWYEYDYSGLLPRWRVFSLRTKTVTFDIPAADTGFSAERPLISNNRLIWGENDNQTHRWQLVSFDLTRVVRSVVASGSGEVQFSSFSGDILTYIANGKTYVLNLKTGQERRLIDNPLFTVSDGRYLFWDDYTTDKQKAPPDQRRVDLKAYDTISDSYFNLTSEGYNQVMVARNGQLFWQRGIPAYGSNLYTARLSDLLPTARRGAITTTPDRSYFLEVGHTLSGAFKGFWDKSGGLPIFGYPLSEEYIEVNQDTGKPFTVQFFERQRFEYHPENKETPYEVELGRLGVSDAARRNLGSTAPFQPASAKGDTNCSYFSETRHNVCGSFLAYWQAHGLEFGDEGISYREALALFGLPISEEFDDTTGFRTQYFERAVFEYHPENKGTPYEVQLKLLGAEKLKQRDWR